jgi:hypothetical protein
VRQKRRLLRDYWFQCSSKSADLQISISELMLQYNWSDPWQPRHESSKGECYMTSLNFGLKEMPIMQLKANLFDTAAWG